jgi:hypothetical protein
MSTTPEKDSAGRKLTEIVRSAGEHLLDFGQRFAQP